MNSDANYLKLDSGKDVNFRKVPEITLIEGLHRLENQQLFLTTKVAGICSIRVDSYLPLVCIALHDGAAFSAKVENSCLLSASERRFEEDPHTAALLDRLPLVVAGCESRYFYDLNRSEQYATRNEVFGRKVWRDGKHPTQLHALFRHRRFYQFVGLLIQQMINQFGFCIVIDLHSYNGSKINRQAPIFNLGTCANSPSQRPLLEYFLGGLSKIELPGLLTSVAENDVFEGRGRFVNWVSRTYPQALPLCLEIKKIYCDEQTGELHPDHFACLQTGLTQIIEELFNFYQQTFLKNSGKQAIHF